MGEELEDRKKKIFDVFKKKKTYLIYLALIIIIWFSTRIRVKNLKYLVDSTTGQYIPVELDSFVILRYAQYILEHGKMMVLDTLRNYPIGFDPQREFSFISYFIVYLYKIVHVFVPSVTLEYIDAIYPPITFAISLVFFFLVVKKLSDYRIALVATALLSVVPTYLYRTIAGFSDKEALAMMMMFIALYFYVSAWQSKKIGKIVIFGAISGIVTGAMGLAWGGVGYVFLIISLFSLIELFLGKFRKIDFYVFTSWLLPLVFVLLAFSYGRFTLSNLAVSFTTGIAFMTFLVALVDFVVFKIDLFKVKQKIDAKMPLGIASTLIALILTAIGSSIFFGIMFIPNKIKEVASGLIYPLTNRWALTVAESHQPYIIDWFSQLGNWYTWFMLIGSLLLWYELVKPLGNKKWWLSAGYVAFILSFIFSRYSSGSRYLNGVSGVAKFLYIGSLVIFFGAIAIFYLYSFYKNKNVFEQFSNFDRNLIFIFVWFLIMVMGARSAVRLIFVFSTITAILVAYFGFRVIDYSNKLVKYKLLKYGTFIFVAIALILVFKAAAQESINQASYMGPSYNVQWQRAGQWARESTPEDAVFAHWWDYGYWVQGGFKRATITDGGNVIGSWNYFMGRHVLMGNSEEEALEFLKTHNATHLLMLSDEIGKYPAFSSIGSDENYDRYSWITTFQQDPSQTQESRNSTVFLYRGSHTLDEDFMYQGKLFPGKSSGIGAIFLPVRQEGESVAFDRPTAVLFYGDQQVNVPLNCLFFDREMIFGDDGLDGCLRIIPTIEADGTGNVLGAGLYLSGRVRKTLFTRLYLFNEETENFKVGYNDYQNFPLAIYQGRLIGPLKIWEISYPDNIQTNPDFLKATYPNPKVIEI